MLKKIFFLLSIINSILYAEFNRKTFIIFDKNNLEVCKHIIIWKCPSKNENKYFFKYDIFYNCDYKIMIAEREICSPLIVLEKYNSYIKNLISLKIIDSFKEIMNLNKLIKLDNFFGYIDIRGKNTSKFYIYFINHFNSNFLISDCGTIIPIKDFFDSLIKENDPKLRELVDVILEQPFFLNFGLKKNKGKHIKKEEYFDCGKAEEEFDFKCEKLKECFGKRK